MSWMSGVDLCQEVWDAVEPYLRPGYEDNAAELICAAFEERNADGLEAIDGPIGDIANQRSMARWLNAPDDPNPGQQHVDQYGETWYFNGRRWEQLGDDD